MTHQTILVASGNKHKIRELQYSAEQFGIELLSPAQAAERLALTSPPEVEETADSYLGNALLKANAYCRWSGLPALGDDSGLEVAALDGRPGIHSARYAGPGSSDRDKMEKLLAEVAAAAGDYEDGNSQSRKRRSALFRCVLAIVYPNGQRDNAEGVLHGHVLGTPRGNKGFGYDPVVYIDELGATLAEVDFEVTCRRGFRARAAQALFAKVRPFA